MKQVTLTEEEVQGLISYLITRPYQEVANGVAALQRALAKAQEGEQ